MATRRRGRPPKISAATQRRLPFNAFTCMVLTQALLPLQRRSRRALAALATSAEKFSASRQAPIAE
eukprot:6174671-Pleurochrysis_carterae.AAC.4